MLILLVTVIVTAILHVIVNAVDLVSVYFSRIWYCKCNFNC